MKHFFPGQVISNQVSIGVEGAPPRSQDPLYPKVKRVYNDVVSPNIWPCWGAVIGQPWATPYPQLFTSRASKLHFARRFTRSRRVDCSAIRDNTSQISAACDCLSWFIKRV